MLRLTIFLFIDHRCPHPTGHNIRDIALLSRPRPALRRPHTPAHPAQTTTTPLPCAVHTDIPLHLRVHPHYPTILRPAACLPPPSHGCTLILLPRRPAPTRPRHKTQPDPKRIPIRHIRSKHARHHHNRHNAHPAAPPSVLEDGHTAIVRDATGASGRVLRVLEYCQYIRGGSTWIERGRVDVCECECCCEPGYIGACDGCAVVGWRQRRAACVCVRVIIRHASRLIVMSRTLMRTRTRTSGGDDTSYSECDGVYLWVEAVKHSYRRRP